MHETLRGVRGIFKNYGALNEFLYKNMIYVLLIICGMFLVFIGVFVSSYKATVKHAVERRFKNSKWLGVLEGISSTFPLSIMRDSIKASLLLSIPDNFYLNLVSNIVTVALACLSILFAVLLKDVGQLWYVKILIITMSVILPYYMVDLLLDLYKYRINRQIPKMIDEFRSAFIKHRKIKMALKECSLYIDSSLGRIISNTADDVFLEESLIRIRDSFNNVWLNIFVVLLVNYKQNGGELIDQLYRLNRSMTTYGNIEKKKNKRLIWYEIFAVSASAFSIPAVIWLNRAILGNDGITDAQSNMIISRVIGFSILSLVVVRILRRL